ncbi:MAG: hypothetical protein CVV20_01490 [Gemmatimonadetes bacterium HGW-Gemmatimonadetes-1]|nr:MAG: hypothetical protein CVV20_01490 [Gemmatimonadetes bacterium HGW-Gemmatimonadetes-1]
MPPGLGTEPARPGPVEIEDDDRPVGERIELGVGADQSLTSDDGSLVNDIEEAILVRADRFDSARPLDRHPAGPEPAHFRQPQQRVDPLIGACCHEILAFEVGRRNDQFLEDRSGWHHSGGIGSGGGIGERSRCLGGVAATEQCRHLIGLSRAGPLPRSGRAHPELGQYSVHRREGVLECAGLVGDHEFEESRLCHDRLGSGRVGDAGELDDDSLVADSLDHRLGHAELVDPLAQNGEREIDVPGRVRGYPHRLVEFETEVHPALQIEAAFERHPTDRDILHHAVGATLPLDHVAREEIEDRQPGQGEDQEHAIL